MSFRWISRTVRLDREFQLMHMIPLDIEERSLAVVIYSRVQSREVEICPEERAVDC